LIIKGKAPVDSECVQLLGKAHVYYEGKDVWDCMLNQVCKAHVYEGKDVWDCMLNKVCKAHVYYEGKDVWDCMLNKE
jgi:hypothetical protein